MPYQEVAMGVNKNQVKGRIKTLEGKVKETAGKVVGNRKLQLKGTVQGIVGAAQATLGDVRQALKNTLKKRRMAA
jgi:uncharacterized protein YjbJ (UPF0337 family)